MSKGNLNVDISKILESFHSFTVDPNSKEMVNENSINSILNVEAELKLFKPARTNSGKVQLLNYLNIIMEALINSNIKTSPISPTQLKFLEVSTLLVDKISSHLLLLGEINIYERMINLFSNATNFIKDNKRLFEELTREGKEELKYSEFEKNTRVDGVNVQYNMLKGIDLTIEKFKRSIRTSTVEAVEDAVVIYLVGPPGTGKSTLAMAAVTEFSHGTFYRFDIANLSNSYVGVAEAGLVNIFKEYSQPNKENITFVFDEIDEILNSTSNHMKSIATTIQIQMSGGINLPKNILIIGITNHYAKLSDAMKRRQTARIFVDIPDPQDVFKFFSSLIVPPELNPYIMIKDFLQIFLHSRFLTDRYTNANIRAIYKNIITFVNTKDNLQRLRINDVYFTLSPLFNYNEKFEKDSAVFPNNIVPKNRHVLPDFQDVISAFKSVKPMTEEDYIDNLVESDELTKELGEFRKLLWQQSTIKVIGNTFYYISNTLPFSKMDGFIYSKIPTKTLIDLDLDEIYIINNKDMDVVKKMIQSKINNGTSINNGTLVGPVIIPTANVNFTPSALTSQNNNGAITLENSDDDSSKMITP